MGWDLWGPSYSEVAPESCPQMQPGLQCDFYFGYGLDVIEEDALNEKSCVQVLRVLVSNADIELEELEKNLVVLQSEFAWAENREWSEICSASLGEKINCLDISIQNLKNENEHDINVDLLMLREPAEVIHDIVKVLLRRYCPEEDEQFPVIIIKCSSSDMPEYATDLSDEKKNLSNFDFNIFSKEGRKESSTNIIEQFNIFNLSLKPCGTKDNRAEMVKVQAANMSIENSSANTFSQGSGCSSENKKFSDSCLKIIEEVQHVSTSTPAITILESSRQPEGNRGEVDDRVEPSGTVEEDSRFNALEHSTNNSDQRKKDCNKKGDSILTDDYKILISSLKAGGKKKNCPKIAKPANVIVGNSNFEALRCEIGFNEKKKSYLSMSRSDVLIQTNSGGDDMIMGSGKFPLKTVRERTVTGSKVAAFKIIAAKSSARPDRKSMIFQEAVISDNEHTVVNSFSELQGQVGNDTTMLHLQGGKPQTEKVWNAKAPAYDRESLSWSSIKPPKAKRKMQSMQLSIQEASLLPKTSLNSYSASKSKRRRKSGTCKDNVSLKQSLNVKILKNLVLQNNCGSDDPGLSSDVNEVSVLLLQKRIQKSLKLPIHMEIEGSTTCNKMPKFNVDTTDGAVEEDLLIINSCSIDDSHDETIKSLPCPKVRLLPLEKMKLVELRAVAKQHNLTKYHKLRKDALVQAIMNQQG